MTNMILPSEIVREYDIRGIVGKTLFPETAEFIGKAIGSRAIREGDGRVVIAYDGRLTSEDLAEKLQKGLLSTGAKVTNLGCGPSPMLYYAAKHYDFTYGIMLTGSHNPPEYNGFKICARHKGIYGEEIKRLADEIRKGEFSEGQGEAISISVEEEYIKRLIKDLKLKKNLRIAFDPANGAGAEICQKLVKLLPGEHFIINEKIDGTFPSHHPDPTVLENLQQVRKLVLDNKCDLGISFDGDADRIGAVDNEGEILFGDQLLILYAREIIEKNPGATIIADIKASNSFVSEVKKAGGNPIIWKTGHSLIKAKMLETKAKLAGEMSGHIFFNDIYYGFDDALYATIRLLNIVSSLPGTLADCRKELPVSYSTPEIRVDCDEEVKFKIVEEIKDKLKKNNQKFNDIDGIRLDYDDSWWLIRASNTSPCLVVRCEADNEDGLEKCKNEVKLLLAEHLSGIF